MWRSVPLMTMKPALAGERIARPQHHRLEQRAPWRRDHVIAERRRGEEQRSLEAARRLGAAIAARRERDCAVAIENNDREQIERAAVERARGRERSRERSGREQRGDDRAAAHASSPRHGPDNGTAVQQHRREAAIGCADPRAAADRIDGIDQRPCRRRARKRPGRGYRSRWPHEHDDHPEPRAGVSQADALVRDWPALSPVRSELRAGGERVRVPAVRQGLGRHI